MEVDLQMAWDMLKWLIGGLVFIISALFGFWWRAHHMFKKSNDEAHESIRKEISKVNDLSAKRHNAVRDSIEKLLELFIKHNGGK